MGFPHDNQRDWTSGLATIPYSSDLHRDPHLPLDAWWSLDLSHVETYLSFIGGESRGYSIRRRNCHAAAVKVTTAIAIKGIMFRTTSAAGGSFKKTPFTTTRK